MTIQKFTIQFELAMEDILQKKSDRAVDAQMMIQIHQIAKMKSLTPYQMANEVISMTNTQKAM